MALSKNPRNAASPTMADIARHVGISTVTVSAVLSASAGNRTGVSDATRQRIQDAAREMNYTPNGIAKMFRRNSTDIIGLYLGDWLLNTHDLFLAEIVSGLQIGCQEYGKDLLIHSKFRDHPVEDIYLELINRKIDGLIMFAQEGDPLATRLASSSLPVVALADAVTSLPSVVTDDRAGSWMIAEYLAAQGHERVLYRRRPSVQTSANRRHTAFLAAAVQHGLTVVEDATRAAGFDLPLSDAEQALLGKPRSERPTAIVCGNDLLAYATVESCQEKNYRVPEDFAVVGFDGIVTQVRPAARLTTIRAPWEKVAQTALGLVVKRLADEPIPDETVLPVELVIGDTA